MDAFWHFAAGMLRYKRLLALAAGAALLDAACAFAGFGLLVGLIQLMFGDPATSLRQTVADRLADPGLRSWIGDRAALAEWIPEGRFAGFAAALGVIFGVALFGSCFRFAHQYLTLTVAHRVVMRLRQGAFHRVLHAPMERVWAMGTADTMTRIVQDSSRLVRGFSALLGKAVRDALMGFVFLGWAFLIDWQLSLIFLIGVVPIAVCIKQFGRRIRRASKYALRRYGLMIGAMQESMQAAPVVRTHNAEGYERRRFNRINRELYQQEMTARTVRALSSPVIELIALAGVIAVTLIAAWYVFHGGGDASAMVVVLVTLAAAGGSVKPLANLNIDLQEAAAGAVRLRETLDAPAEPHRAADWNRPPLPRHTRGVRFEHVSYTYPGTDVPALIDFDLAVPHGHTVALVGPNGSGKSTTLSLLPRLIQPTRGRVLLDGHDLADHSLRSLRKQLAIVTQHTTVFEGTIADNIAYGRRHTPRDAVVAAARQAHAHEFITQLPDGYDTVLGEGGTGLSGGQKQRLCIARAILRDPAVLILDEATSQIDAESEAKIHAAMKTITRGRTTFIIAHRLSTVVDADHIVVLSGGRILDQGTHHQLLQRCELYQSLVRHQMAEPTAA